MVLNVKTILSTKDFVNLNLFSSGWVGKNRRINQIEQMRCQNPETYYRTQYWIVKSATNSFPIIIKIINVAAATRVEKLIAVSYCRQLAVGMDQS